MRRAEHCVNQTLDSCYQERAYAQHVQALQRLEHKHAIDASEPECPLRLQVYNQQNSDAKREVLAQANYLYSLIPRRNGARPVAAKPREKEKTVKKRSSDGQKADLSNDFFLTQRGSKVGDYVDAGETKERKRPLNLWDFDEETKECAVVESKPSSRGVSPRSQRKNAYPERRRQQQKMVAEKFQSRFYRPDRLNEKPACDEAKQETFIEEDDESDRCARREKTNRRWGKPQDETESEASECYRQDSEDRRRYPGKSKTNDRQPRKTPKVAGSASGERDERRKVVCEIFDEDENGEASNEDDVTVEVLPDDGIRIDASVFDDRAATESTTSGDEVVLHPLLVDVMITEPEEKKEKKTGSLLDQVRSSAERKKNQTQNSPTKGRMPLTMKPIDRRLQTLEPLEPTEKSHDSSGANSPMKPLLTAFTKSLMDEAVPDRNGEQNQPSGHALGSEGDVADQEAVEVTVEDNGGDLPVVGGAKVESDGLKVTNEELAQDVASSATRSTDGDIVFMSESDKAVDASNREGDGKQETVIDERHDRHKEVYDVPNAENVETLVGTMKSEGGMEDQEDPTRQTGDRSELVTSQTLRSASDEDEVSLGGVAQAVMQAMQSESGQVGQQELVEAKCDEKNEGSMANEEQAAELGSRNGDKVDEEEITIPTETQTTDSDASRKTDSGDQNAEHAELANTVKCDDKQKPKWKRVKRRKKKEEECTIGGQTESGNDQRKDSLPMPVNDAAQSTTELDQLVRSAMAQVLASNDEAQLEHDPPENPVTDTDINAEAETRPNVEQDGTELKKKRMKRVRSSRHTRQDDKAMESTSPQAPSDALQIPEDGGKRDEVSSPVLEEVGKPASGDLAERSSGEEHQETLEMPGLRTVVEGLGTMLMGDGKDTNIEGESETQQNSLISGEARDTHDSNLTQPEDTGGEQRSAISASTVEKRENAETETTDTTQEFISLEAIVSPIVSKIRNEEGGLEQPTDSVTRIDDVSGDATGRVPRDLSDTTADDVPSMKSDKSEEDVQKQVIRLGDSQKLELLVFDKTGSPLLTIRSSGDGIEATDVTATLAGAEADDSQAMTSGLSSGSPKRQVKRRCVVRVKKDGRNEVSQVRTTGAEDRDVDYTEQRSEQQDPGSPNGHGESSEKVRKIIRTRRVVKRVRVRELADGSRISLVDGAVADGTVSASDSTGSDHIETNDAMPMEVQQPLRGDDVKEDKPHEDKEHASSQARSGDDSVVDDVDRSPANNVDGEGVTQDGHVLDLEQQDAQIESAVRTPTDGDRDAVVEAKKDEEREDSARRDEPDTGKLSDIMKDLTVLAAQTSMHDSEMAETQQHEEPVVTKGDDDGQPMKKEGENEMEVDDGARGAAETKEERMADQEAEDSHHSMEETQSRLSEADDQDTGVKEGDTRSDVEAREEQVADRSTDDGCDGKEETPSREQQDQITEVGESANDAGVKDEQIIDHEAGDDSNEGMKSGKKHDASDQLESEQETSYYDSSYYDYSKSSATDEKTHSETASVTDDGESSSATESESRTETSDTGERRNAGVIIVTDEMSHERTNTKKTGKGKSRERTTTCDDEKGTHQGVAEATGPGTIDAMQEKDAEQAAVSELRKETEEGPVSQETSTKGKQERDMVRHGDDHERTTRKEAEDGSAEAAKRQNKAEGAEHMDSPSIDETREVPESELPGENTERHESEERKEPGDEGHRTQKRGHRHHRPKKEQDRSDLEKSKDGDATVTKPNADESKTTPETDTVESANPEESIKPQSDEKTTRRHHKSAHGSRKHSKSEPDAEMGQAPMEESETELSTDKGNADDAITTEKKSEEQDADRGQTEMRSDEKKQSGRHHKRHHTDVDEKTTTDADSGKNGTTEQNSADGPAKVEQQDANVCQTELPASETKKKSSKRHRSHHREVGEAPTGEDGTKPTNESSATETVKTEQQEVTQDVVDTHAESQESRKKRSSKRHGSHQKKVDETAEEKPESEQKDRGDATESAEAKQPDVAQDTAGTPKEGTDSQKKGSKRHRSHHKTGDEKVAGGLEGQQPTDREGTMEPADAEPADVAQDAGEVPTEVPDSQTKKGTSQRRRSRRKEAEERAPGVGEGEPTNAVDKPESVKEGQKDITEDAVGTQGGSQETPKRKSNRGPRSQRKAVDENGNGHSADVKPETDETKDGPRSMWRIMVPPQTTRTKKQVHLEAEENEVPETDRPVRGKRHHFPSLYLSSEELTRIFLDSPAQYEDAEPAALMASDKSMIADLVDRERVDDECLRILPISGMLGMLHIDKGLQTARATSSSRVSTRSVRSYQAEESTHNDEVRFI